MQNSVQFLPDILVDTLKTCLTPFVYLNGNLDCLYANIAFCNLFHEANSFSTARSVAKAYFTEEHFIATDYAPNIFELVPTLQSEGMSEDLFKSYFLEAKKTGSSQFQCFHEDKNQNIRQLFIVVNYLSYDGIDLFACQLKETHELRKNDDTQKEVREAQSEIDACTTQTSGMRFTQNLALIKSIPLFAHAWDDERHEFDFGKACELYQVMNDTMPICSYLFAPDYTMKDCNQEVARLFKTTKEYFLLHFRDFVPHMQPDGRESLEKARSIYKESMETGYSRFEWTFIDSDKNPIQADMTVYKVNYQGQDMLAAFGIDLRETKEYITQIQETLEEQHEREKIILDSLPISVAYWNEKQEIVACNNTLLKLFNVPDLQYYKENFSRFFPNTLCTGEDSQQAVTRTIQETFEKGYARTDFERLDNDGNLLYVDVTSVRFEQGGKRYVGVYTVDITAIKKHDKEIEEANARTNLMLNTFPIGATLWNKDFKVLDCNLEVINLIGYESKEAYLNYANTLNPEALPLGREYYELFFAVIKRVFESGYEHLEWETRHKNGHFIPVELTAIRVKHHTEDAVVVYTRDIRLKRKLLEEIQEAHSRTQIMLNTFPMGANFWNKDLQIIDCNQEMVKLAGYQSKEEYLQHRSTQSAYFMPQGREYEAKVFEIVTKAFISGYEQVEWITKHKDGYDIPVERTFIRVQNEKGEDSIIGYMRDLREHKKMMNELIEVQEDLQKVKELAERNANIKGEFLAHMSHEIRTPMNGIIGLVHLLLESNLTVLQEEYAQKTLDCAKHLLRVVNDILDLSAFEKGNIKMEKVAFSLDEVFEQLDYLFKQKALNKNLTFNLTREKNTKGKLFGDPMRLKQALFNLVSNAIKFTEKGGVLVSVHVTEQSETQKTLLFKISDTGIGIKEDHILKLFSAFSQAESFITRQYGGTGLGLLLSKKIVEAMHGEIWVESEYGKYSTFYFYVTLDIVEETMPLDHTFNIAYDRYIPPKERAEEGNKQQILIVEDNKINQLITRELLKKHGYPTVIVENGQEALDILEKEVFAIVLMDIQMPIMDGLTATKEIRKRSQFKDLPIIAVSAHGMEGDKEICLESGMNEYVRKPISPPELLKAIETHLM